MADGKTYSRHGFILHGDKLKSGSLHYNEPDRTKMYAYGTPISIEAAQKIIENFWQYLKGLYKNKSLSGVAGEQRVAFTIGKEALFSILAQENCEAVRFYLAKKEEGITLVPIGVMSKSNGEKEIGATKTYIMDKSTRTTLNPVNVPIPECLPSKTLNEYINGVGIIDENGFDEVFLEYVK